MTNMNILDAIRNAKTKGNQLMELVSAFNEAVTSLNVDGDTIAILSEISDTSDLRNEIQTAITMLSAIIGQQTDIDDDPTQETETTPVVEVPEVEEVEEEITAPQVVEISSSTPPTPEAKEALRHKEIRINAEVSATVYDDGTIEVFGNKLEPFLDQSGMLTVDMPVSETKREKTCKIRVHTLVAQAFIPKPDPTKKDGIIHKNDNPFDCRVSNLGWRSITKKEIPNIDAGDATDICEGLVACHFDMVATMTWLATRHKRCSQYAITRVLNKEIFPQISDRYFDNRCHVVKCLPATSEVGSEEAIPAPQAVESDEDRAAVIRQYLEKAEEETTPRNINKMRLAFMNARHELEYLTLYEVFNAKYGASQAHPNGVGKPSDEDIYEIIRYAASRGEDVRTTILTECNISVSSTQITIASRQRV